MYVYSNFRCKTKFDIPVRMGVTAVLEQLQHVLLAEVGLGAPQFLERRRLSGQLGSDLHASFLQKFPGGESGKVFNFICLLAFSELCMYCPPNLPESLCSGWSNFESA